MFVFHHNKSSFWQVLLSAIAVIMAWRGIWNLLDDYLLPNWRLASSLVSLVAGIVLLYILDRNLRSLK